MRKRIKNLAFALKVDVQTLIDLSNAINASEDSFYRSWDKPKTDEKGNKRYKNGNLLTRPINAPIFELKHIQRKILRNVLYKIKLPQNYFGGVKKKDAVLNARYHQGNKYFLSTDLKDFYPSISYLEVEKSLRKQGFYPDVSRLITRIGTKNGAIPQGCPTSSFLASLVIHNCAGDLLINYEKQNKKVSLYIDDLTISSPIDFKIEVDEILNELRNRGLKINFDKTYYRSENPIVTGVVVKNNGICAMPHTFERAEDDSRTIESREGHKVRINYIKRIKNKKTQP